MISFYNDEVERFKQHCSNLLPSDYPDVKTFVMKNPKKISWGGGNWQSSFKKFELQIFEPETIKFVLYRPFTRNWHYGARNFNHSFYSMPRIFPDTLAKNRVICVTGRGANKDFCVLMTDTLPDLEMISKGQCFPLKLYESNSSDKPSAATPQAEMFDDAPEVGLFDGAAGQYTVKDGITEAGLAHFVDFYAQQRVAQGECQTISKEDVFYYIYGLLHSEDYKSRYADNLTKELPRIPRVKQYADFIAFMEAGRALADLHVNYETVAMFPVNFVGGALAVQGLEDKDFYVTKMKFSKGSGVDEEGKAIKHDKTRIEYNAKITLTDIPLEAYTYIVNGKPAIEWVMERQSVTTHKDSGIVNDANDWAIETMGNARYPLELLQRVITVSVETMKIVNALPKLDI